MVVFLFRSIDHPNRYSSRSEERRVGKEEIASGFDTIRLVANLEQMDKDSMHIIYGMVCRT